MSEERQWVTDVKTRLREFKGQIDCDDVKVKEAVKQQLLSNRYIIHVLNNPELEALVEDDGTGSDEYFGVNILPYYLVSPTQSHAAAYICFEVTYDELQYRNSAMKRLNIIFTILCDQKIIKDADTGIARHDLLAALIQDQFNYTNYFGSTIELISDEPSTVDKTYACRTLVFQQLTDNNLVKTVNGKPRLANKLEAHTFV